MIKGHLYNVGEIAEQDKKEAEKQLDRIRENLFSKDVDVLIYSTELHSVNLENVISKKAHEINIVDLEDENLDLMQYINPEIIPSVN